MLLVLVEVAVLVDERLIEDLFDEMSLKESMLAFVLALALGNRERLRVYSPKTELVGCKESSLRNGSTPESDLSRLVSIFEVSGRCCDCSAFLRLAKKDKNV